MSVHVLALDPIHQQNPGEQADERTDGAWHPEWPTLHAHARTRGRMLPR